jgi:WD40 repeat protein
VRIAIPEALKDLLRLCFKENIAERPQDFAEVEKDLLEIYKEEIGDVYPRPIPKAASNTADSLNNRALSFLDMGMPDAAERCWEEALAIHPDHPVSLYNQLVYLWANAKIDDTKAIRKFSGNISQNSNYYLSKLYLACGDTSRAIKCLDEAIKLYGDTKGIRNMLQIAQDMIENGHNLKCLYTHSKYHFTEIVFGKSGNTALIKEKKEEKITGIKLINVETGQLIQSFDGRHRSDKSYPEKTSFVIEQSKRNNVTIESIPFEGDTIYPVCISPDGSKAVIGEYILKEEQKAQCVVHICDVATGQCIHTLAGHTRRIMAFSFSSDGNFAMSGGEDNVVKLWDLSSGECVRTSELKGFGAKLKVLRFSPNNKRALSGYDNGTIKLWGIESGQCIRSLEGHKEGIQSLCFSSDGNFALSSGCYSHPVKLWDLLTGQCHTFDEHLDSIYDACFSPDDSKILSGSEGTIKLWDMETKRCICTFSGGRLKGIGFSENGERIFSATGDEIQCWNVPKNNIFERVLSKINTADAVITQQIQYDLLLDEIRILSDNKNISGALNMLENVRKKYPAVINYRYFSLKRELAKFCVRGNVSDQKVLFAVNHEAFDIKFSPDGRRLLTFGGDSFNEMKLWDIATGECIHIFEVECAFMDGVSVKYSPDGKTALSQGTQQSVSLWDLETGKRKHIFELGEYYYITDFSPDGSKLLLSVSYLKKKPDSIMLIDLKTFKCIRQFIGHQDFCETGCFSPDGSKVLTGSRDKTIKLWDVSSGECIRTFTGHKDDVNSVCFSSDGKRIVSSSHDGSIKLWNIANGRCIRTFPEAHDEMIVDTCISPDGKKLLSDGGDYAVKLWNTATAECVEVQDCRRVGEISNAYFSPDSQRVLFIRNWESDSEPSVRLLDASTGQLDCVLGDQSRVETRTICFSRDGTKIASARENELIVYDLEYELTFPGWQDWDEGARPYLETFRRLHPDWTDDDFETILLPDLQNRGYGWLRPESVKAKLKKQSAKKRIL